MVAVGQLELAGGVLIVTGVALVRLDELRRPTGQRGAGDPEGAHSQGGAAQRGAEDLHDRVDQPRPTVPIAP